MRSTTLTLLALLTASAATGIAREVDSAIRDTAARIDYGWFTGELGLILAARDALVTPASDSWTSYVYGYASYRAAQLLLARGAAIGPLVDDCAASAAEAARDNEAEAEAMVLQAACAALAAAAEPMRSVLHQRRFRQAMERARVLDANNPRLLLVDYLSAQAAGKVEPRALAAVVDAFRDPARRHDYPDWGQVEALTELGLHRLESGNLRGARDLLEEALLLAPDYAVAVEIRRRIGSLTPTN